MRTPIKWSGKCRDRCGGEWLSLHFPDHLIGDAQTGL